ncbi:MAG: hypothetical protein K0S99_3265, partial [Thermomicrobiales bacterium]|nr:hypothetical protein [Thermomicrobiales bacterium]
MNVGIDEHGHGGDPFPFSRACTWTSSWFPTRPSSSDSSNASNPSPRSVQLQTGGERRHNLSLPLCFSQTLDHDEEPRASLTRRLYATASSRRDAVVPEPPAADDHRRAPEEERNVPPDPLLSGSGFVDMMDTEQ